MKKSIKYLVIGILAILGASCEKQEAILSEPGRVTFSFSAEEFENGKAKNTGNPSFIFLNVKNAAGVTVLENKKLTLLSFGTGYTTEPIELGVGSYSITAFIVLDENNHALYATPVAGSPKADLVQHPLPITFIVPESSSTELKPEVIEITSQDSPEKFGYVSFGFNVIGDEKINVSVKVELTVGKIVYRDIDTNVKVTGFNSSNEAKWSEEFIYVGPDANNLSVKKGFHHYEFAINHFGITDYQIINADHLIEGSSGEVPLTYVLGGSRTAKKLTSYVNYIERPDPANWGQTFLDPETSVEYEYHGSGRVDKMRIYGFVDSLNTFVEQRYFNFTYEGDRLSQLSGYHVGQVSPYIEDFYTYQENGNVSGIQDVNYAGGITTTVDVTYDFTDRVVNAVYRLSNGTGFEYKFDYIRNNISKDLTTRFGALCNTGSYTYDKNINPLAHLGYQDFLFNNYSINNKIAENMIHTGCAFPTLIPELYQYKYDSEGFATEQTTFYKSSKLVMKRKYFYQ
jgi:hypothetical protein